MDEQLRLEVEAILLAMGGYHEVDSEALYIRNGCITDKQTYIGCSDGRQAAVYSTRQGLRWAKWERGTRCKLAEDVPMYCVNDAARVIAEAIEWTEEPCDD